MARSIEKTEKLLIQNMVCQRCVMTVTDILNRLKTEYTSVTMGEVTLPKKVSGDELTLIEKELNKVGFALIETRVNKVIADIKRSILDYINLGLESQRQNLSAFITDSINYEYSYLSDLFSSIEGRTIEQYFIVQRIEKVKELLVYEQLSLTEISYRTGFSSVHHLSAQFKKVTGLTPSHFNKLTTGKRKSIDEV